MGVHPLEPRTLRADKDERFWATRGKRSSQDQHFWAARGKRGVVMKPNGLFGITQGKRSSFKPNSLFSITGGKRSSFKPNSLFSITAGKRSSFKPNSLFSLHTGKRSYLKPNGLFSSFEGKRSLSLKPNGLFSLPKRSVLNSPTMDSELSTNFEGKMEPISNAVYWGIPNGLFGAYKRAMKPNGNKDNNNFLAARG